MKILIRALNINISILFYAVCSLAQTASWQTLPNSPSTTWRYDDVSFINPLTGWVVWDNSFGGSNTGRIYKTTDGGNSWTMQFSLNNVYFRSIEFADSLNGWMGTLGNAFGQNNYEMYYTTDGGTQWQPDTAIQNFFNGLCGISAVSKDFVFACGRVQVISRVSQFVKTTNGGLNWSYMDMSAYATELIDCYFFNKDSGFVVGGLNNGSKVLFTSDGGNSWINRYSDNLGSICWKIFFVNRNTGYISSNQYPSFLKTTDGGNTWNRMIITTAGLDFVQGIGFLNENTGWIGGFSAFKTTDGGLNWQQDNFGMNINRFIFLSDTLGYAVGRRVYKFTNKNVGINHTSTNIPDNFFLFQNYPNPFNPETNIKFDISRTINSELPIVRLKIYDALGKEVAVLVNEKLSAGSYEVGFDGANMPSGIYFYKLEADNFVETKRMILLK